MTRKNTGPSKERCERFGLSVADVASLNESCVYLVRGRGTNYWKVGVTTRILSRLVTIEENTPFHADVAVLIASHDDVRTENEILESVSEWRCRGEWHAVHEVELPFFALRVDEGVMRGGGRYAARGRAYSPFSDALDVAERCRGGTSRSDPSFWSAPCRSRNALEVLSEHYVRTPLDHARHHLGRRIGDPDLTQH